MTLTIELNATQERNLRHRADAVGQEPTEYLLAAAGIATSPEQSADDASITTESAYDLFAGLIGGFSSGGAHLSKNTGEAFADGMVVKYRNPIENGIIGEGS